MKTSKLFLFGSLVLALCMAVPVMAGVPNLPFTGDVEADFLPGPGILIITDPGGQDVPVPGTTNVSGWDLKDLRLAYDSGTDTLYVGVNNYGVVGDPEGNGNPNPPWDPLVPGNGEDYEDLSGSESVAVFIDLDMFGYPTFDDGSSWDVIIGVGTGMSTDHFGVYNTVGTIDPSSNFDFDETNPPTFNRIPGHDGPTFLDTDLDHPDLEFAITNFSTLAASLTPPLTDDVIGAFRVGVYEGSGDDTSGEEHIFYQQLPFTEVTIVATLDDVLEGDTVSLEVTEHNDSFTERADRRPAYPDPVPDDLKVPYNFFPAQVDVAQEGTTIATLIPLPPSGSSGWSDQPGGNDDVILNQGETWTWSGITSQPVTVDPTHFRARGSGTGPIGFIHSYIEAPLLEEKTVTVDVIFPGTMVTIDPIPTEVPLNSTVNTIVYETNDGEGDLTDVQVVVTQTGYAAPIAILDRNSTGWSDQPGGNGDDVLNSLETWSWPITSEPITEDPTEIVAIGSGNIDGFTVTWCVDPGNPPDNTICDEEERAVVSTRPREEPEIDVVKTVDCVEPLPVPGSSVLETIPGYPVFYKICIKNIGNVPVLPTLVYDDRLGDLTADFVAGCPVPLEPQTECCLTYGPFFYDGSENPIPNTVTFEADDLMVPPQAAEPVFDDATVVLLDPGFEVTKICLTDPVPEGQPATFEIEITNTGDVDLIVLTDEPTLPGPLPLPAGGLPIVHEVDVPVPPDVTEVCNVINVMAYIDTPDNVCIDGEPVEPPQDASDCCPVPPPGGEGCTPGFWKNNGDKHGASAWCDLFSPSDPISMHFDLDKDLVIRGKGRSTITNPTLLQALNANGGGVNAMIRHGVAAMLNACSDCVQYEYSSPDQVIMMIEDALNGVGDYTVGELHSMFAENNEAGCPVNQHGDCAGVED